MADIAYPEPTWLDEPQVAYCRPSYLRSYGTSPYIISGVVLRLLQYHFSSIDNISDPYLQFHQWDPSRELTKIHIGTGMAVDQDVVSRHPAVHVALEATKATKMGVLQDGMTPIAATSEGYIGQRDFNMLLRGGTRILCVSKVETEAFLLAQEIFLRMMTYAAKIREDIGVGGFNVEGLYPAKPTELHGGESAFFASVNLTWENMQRWSLVAEAPTIKRLYMKHTVTI